MVEEDEDGDLLVRRRGDDRSLVIDESRDEDAVLSELHMDVIRTAKNSNKMYKTEFSIKGQPSIRLRHSLATPLEFVGLQVWRGAALLTDYLLHLESTLQRCTVLELGAGPGLPSIALSRFAACAYATDTGSSNLRNCAHNVVSNGASQVVKVRQLDWLSSDISSIFCLEDNALNIPNNKEQMEVEEFSWKATDACKLKTSLDLIVAADTVYDNTVTEAFMRTVLHIMNFTASEKKPPPKLVIALERRECFTLQDMAACAPAFDFWKSLFLTKEQEAALIEDYSHGKQTQTRTYKIINNFRDKGLLCDERGNVLVGRCLDITILPQRVDYVRGDFLELWELERKNLNDLLRCSHSN